MLFGGTDRSAGGTVSLRTAAAGTSAGFGGLRHRPVFFPAEGFRRASASAFGLSAGLPGGLPGGFAAGLGGGLDGHRAGGGRR